MKYIVASLLALIFCSSLYAQCKTSTFINYQGFWIDDIMPEKVNDGWQYPYPSTDRKTKLIIPKNGDTCLLIDSNNNILASAQFSKGLKLNFEGRLTEYYPNGKVRTKGYYHNNEKIGLWEFYYPNGNLKERYTIGHIIDTNGQFHSGIIGTYEYYYENGNIQEQGQYSLRKSVCTDSIQTIDPITTEESWLVENVPCWHSVKTGYWNTYNEQGILTEEKYYNEDAD